MKTLKAVVAAMVSLLGTVGMAIDDEMVTGEEWGLIVTALIAAYGLVWAAPNRDV